MPTISMFYGILIRMFFRDVDRHHEPHIHADYQGAGPMRIVEVIPERDAVLCVRAEDGRVGRFDVAPYLDLDAFMALRNAVEFQRVGHGGYFVEWACGADLSADTIEARWVCGDGHGE
jgi:hypothetical protein